MLLSTAAPQMLYIKLQFLFLLLTKSRVERRSKGRCNAFRDEQTKERGISHFFTSSLKGTPFFSFDGWHHVQTHTSHLGRSKATNSIERKVRKILTIADEEIGLHSSAYSPLKCPVSFYYAYITQMKLPLFFFQASSTSQAASQLECFQYPSHHFICQILLVFTPFPSSKWVSKPKKFSF